MNILRNQIESESHLQYRGYKPDKRQIQAKICSHKAAQDTTFLLGRRNDCFVESTKRPKYSTTIVGNNTDFFNANGVAEIHQDWQDTENGRQRGKCMEKSSIQKGVSHTRTKFLRTWNRRRSENLMRARHDHTRTYHHTLSWRNLYKYTWKHPPTCQVKMACPSSTNSKI